MYPDTSILWRRIDRSGHEYARLSREGTGWRLEGVALFEHERLPCNLRYIVSCDEEWLTKGAQVVGWVGSRVVDVRIIADTAQQVWRLNDQICADVAGSLDVDLNFSPSTNLLPIRRLGLAVGQRAEVRAAWLRFPSFTLEPLVQSYARTNEHTYVYESGGGSFVAQLQVADVGWPIAYENLWSSEASV
jgi:uncharacterized protein